MTKSAQLPPITINIFQLVLRSRLWGLNRCSKVATYCQNVVRRGGTRVMFERTFVPVISRYRHRRAIIIFSSEISRRERLES